MANALTAEELNKIASGSGYTGGTFSSVGLPASQTSPTPTQQIQSPTVPTTTTQQTTKPTTQPTQPLAYDPAVNPSVIDLLNTAGQESSFANRQQLAQQYGIQNYTGTAQQNIELGKKFTDAFNQMKGGQIPETGAAAGTALDQYFQEKPGEETPQGTPEQRFFDSLGAMNPIEANLFQQLSGLLSATNNQQSLREFYDQEFKAQGIEALNLELADVNRIMEGTEDDIRAEISNAGGFATDSQVRAITGARNKTLLKQANYLSNVLQSKNEYLDRIVSLTQADREQVSKDLDRKLGITETLFNMSQSMERASRENYQSIVKNIGYNGLVDSISSKEELSRVAQSLGMSPQTLLQLSAIPTSAQRDQELAEMNFELSKDKFEEDKRQFGLQYALEQNKIAQKNAADQTVSPYRQRLSQVTLDTIGALKEQANAKTVGYAGLLSWLPESEAGYFASQVESLKAQIFANELTAMREASKTGGAVGNVSDKDGDRLAGILGSLNTTMSPAQFKEQLGKIEDNIYSWNAQVMSIQKEFDYKSAKDAGYTNEEIFKYVENL